MALDGFIFDLDGTLVDSNGAHVEAWRRTLGERGYKVSPDRIFAELGKGGDKLVPHLLGREADDRDGDALRAAQPRNYAQVIEQQGLRPIPGAVALLAELRRRGLKTALATSSKHSQLRATIEASGVDWPAHVDQLATADDARQSKPAPDIVVAGVKKLAMSPAQCVMVGDTPWDAAAARDAGVICLGVTAGGHGEADLISSGARAVYRDPAELLARLDEALRAASPGDAHLTQKVLESLMREALSAAREGLASGEVPIGACLARGSGIVIAHGFNRQIATGNRTAHAEMTAFANAAGAIPDDARDAILVSTLEPCVMCLGAAMMAAVDTVVFGLKAPADRGVGRVRPPASAESQMPRIVGNVLAKESRALFEQWLKKPDKNPRQEEFVRQLLALTE